MKKTFILTLGICLASIGYCQVWQPVEAGTTLKLNSVSFGSQLVGYIGANDSTLLKTMDGGQNWTVHPTTGFRFSTRLPNITHVEFVTADTGFAMLGLAPFDGYMYKTIDGGSHWTPEVVSMCSPIFTYHFDSENAYIIGSSCFGGKTINKKVNGVIQPNTTYLSWGNEYLRTISFYDTLYGIAAGDSGTVHRTFNGGVSWDTVTTFSDEIIWDLQFVNDSTIYGVVDSLSNTLMFSTDSGATWSHHSQALTFISPKFKALTGMQNEGVIAVGSAVQAQIGFITWGSESSFLWDVQTAPQILNNVTAVNDTLAFAVGDSGLIMANWGIVNGVDSPELKLEIRVYPNPASHQISVQSEQGEIHWDAQYNG